MAKTRQRTAYRRGAEAQTLCSTGNTSLREQQVEYQQQVEVRDGHASNIACQPVRATHEVLARTASGLLLRYGYH